MHPSARSSRPFVIGVCGGSGSGKTTVADRLVEAVATESAASVALVRLDSYYCDQSERPFEDRVDVNYDHPDAFDWPLLVEHLTALRAGDGIAMPVYDFAAYTRADRTVWVPAAAVVVVEGILVLWEEAVRSLCDLRIYVETDADVRFIRRLERDVRERGRTVDSVVEQYLTTVRPSHLQFVEPSKAHADVIIPRGGRNEPALDMLISRVQALLT